MVDLGSGSPEGVQPSPAPQAAALESSAAAAVVSSRAVALEGSSTQAVAAAGPPGSSFMATNVLFGSAAAEDQVQAHALDAAEVEPDFVSAGSGSVTGSSSLHNEPATRAPMYVPATARTPLQQQEAEAGSQPVHDGMTGVHEPGLCVMCV